eukprot:TRINITY_DN8039_c0_g1_i1.p1 TRINITY_DN8039_c0_g1~~TRINITY_DN8039_c0_g1_i1.p1  ORF type:complete len:223 (-),score=43.99 TRINITY_DN8039_c0_g1_i1:64-732(-)
MKFVITFAVLAFLTIGAIALRVEIDFDELTGSCNYYTQGSFTDAYSPFGVTFGSGGNGPKLLSYCALDQSTQVYSYSKPNFLGWTRSQDGRGRFNTIPFKISFASPVAFVQVSVAGFDKNKKMSLVAFDGSGMQLGSDTVDLKRNVKKLKVAANNISYVRLRTTDATAGILDDLVIDTVIPKDMVAAAACASDCLDPDLADENETTTTLSVDPASHGRWPQK